MQGAFLFRVFLQPGAQPLQMLLLHRLTKLFVGLGEVPVLFQKAHLQQVPFALIAHRAVSKELVIEGPSDPFEIASPQVIEIGVAKDPGQMVPRRLGDACGHDHGTNALHLPLTEPVAREDLAYNTAACKLMLPALDEEATIVEKRGGLQQHKVFPIHTFLLGDADGTGVHVQGMLQAVVGPLGGQFVP